MPTPVFTSTYQPKNRKGRGKSQRTKLIEAMERAGETEEGFYDLLISKAFNPEDDFAMKEVLNRMHPLKKAVAPSIRFDFDEKESLSTLAENIMKATADGDIAPDISKMMMDNVSSMIKIKEVTELEERIESLESAVGK